MAILFPAGTPGGTFTAGNGVTYTYDGTAGVWTAAGGGGGGSFLPLAGGTMTGAIVNAAGTAAAPSLSFTGDLDTGFYSPGAGIVGIANNGTGNVFVDASGRLLVGTSTTTVGNGSSAFAQFIGNTSSPVGQASVVIGNTGTVSTFNATTGIGVIRFMESSSGAEFGTVQCSADGTCGANDYPGRLSFFTTPDGSATPLERVRITSSGNVLIGGTLPASPNITLNAAGDATFGNAGSGGNVTIQNTNTQFITLVNDTGGNAYVSYHTVDGTAYTIGQSSNARSLRMGSGGGWLTTGVQLSAGATAWSTYSDERLKTDIVELTGCLDNIKDIRCVSYRLTNVDESHSKKRLGVIAQDLVGKYDEAVAASRRSDEDDTEYLSVQYTDLVPVVIKALQEAMARIEELEARLDAAGV